MDTSHKSKCNLNKPVNLTFKCLDCRIGVLGKNPCNRRISKLHAARVQAEIWTQDFLKLVDHFFPQSTWLPSQMKVFHLNVPLLHLYSDKCLVSMDTVHFWFALDWIATSCIRLMLEILQKQCGIQNQTAKLKQTEFYKKKKKLNLNKNVKTYQKKKKKNTQPTSRKHNKSTHLRCASAAHTHLQMSCLSSRLPVRLSSTSAAERFGSVGRNETDGRRHEIFRSGPLPGFLSLSRKGNFADLGYTKLEFKQQRSRTASRCVLRLLPLRSRSAPLLSSPPLLCSSRRQEGGALRRCMRGTNSRRFTCHHRIRAHPDVQHRRSGDGWTCRGVHKIFLFYFFSSFFLSFFLLFEG